MALIVAINYKNVLQTNLAMAYAEGVREIIKTVITELDVELS